MLLPSFCFVGGLYVAWVFFTWVYFLLEPFFFSMTRTTQAGSNEREAEREREWGCALFFIY
jgi:hypothetical protein